MTRPASKQTLLTLAVMIPAASMLLGAGPKKIQRESSRHRAELTAMETKAFDRTMLGSLTDWSHPGTLDESSTKGKVVVLAMIASGDPQSIMTVSTLTRLQEDYAGQGVVIAGIHPDAGFDAMSERIKSGDVTLPIARDEGGLFAKAMHADSYPELYLIDRAGNLRFADINKRSLKDAVKVLASETPESAMTNAALQSQGIAPKSSVMTAKDIDKSEYKNADWPEFNSREMSAKNYQGQPLPVPLGNEEWVLNERSLENKVLVLDFWATWCGPCIAAAPMLHSIQDTYDGKLEVVGIGGSESESDFKRYVLKKKGNYAQMFDGNRTISSALEIKGIPHVVIVSTDGVIRWQGNPHDPAFRRAVAQTVRADPLLAANN